MSWSKRFLSGEPVPIHCPRCGKDALARDTAPEGWTGLERGTMGFREWRCPDCKGLPFEVCAECGQEIRR